MKNSIIIICMLLFFQLSIGQIIKPESGGSSVTELMLQKYEKDPTAEAAVLYDIGSSYFVLGDAGFELIFERKIKIKIFSKAGLKWADFSIPYYTENNESEIIYDLSGNTFNLVDGKVSVTPLNLKNTYSEKFTENWYDKKFAMPDVKEGSVIEIRYKIKTPYYFNLRDWEFQSTIPVMYSEYTTKMIPFYEYIYILQGKNKFDSFESFVEGGLSNNFNGIEYQNMVYVFKMKEVPAFKDESFITSINDYLIKINFQLSVIHYTSGAKTERMTTWSKLSKEMIDHAEFGKYMKECEKKAEEIIDTMSLDNKTQIEKARQIDLFVKRNFNWNGRKEKFASIKAKELLVKKSGNCTDINLFLTGALNAAGIEAYPVLISTRDHGKIKIDYPFHHFFNYVIVAAKIDSSVFLLDATSSLCSFNQLPARCLNDMGLIVQKNQTEWVNLVNSTESDISYYFNLRLNPALDSIYQECKISTQGYEAVSYRNEYLSDYEDLKANLYQNSTASSDSLKIENLYEIQKPFKISFKKRDPVQRLEEKIIISPFCNSAVKENPLKQLSRNYPVDMIYRKGNTFTSQINIPEGYKIFKNPANIDVSNNLVRIKYTSELINDNTFVVSGLYEFRKDVYGPAEYAQLKGFYNIIVEKFNEDLIFVKQN